MFSPSIIFFMLFPNGFVPSDEAFCTARNEKPTNMVLTETKYCTSFSNRLNAPSPAITLECPRRLTKDQFLYKSC